MTTGKFATIPKASIIDFSILENNTVSQHAQRTLGWV